MTSTDPFSRLVCPDRPFRLVVTGGGTGGHTYPALTAIRELHARLAARGGSLDALWVGTSDGLEARVARAEGIAFRAVPTGRLRRSTSLVAMVNRDNLRDMARVPQGVAQARAVLDAFRADVVLSTGGYVAVPVGLAAKLTGAPLVVHEQTVRLGLANRVLARIASAVAVSSASTLPLLSAGAAERAVVTGNPVRPAVLTGDADKAVAGLGLSGFDRLLPTVYVTGGAQGSAQINGMVREILPWLLARANVVHQCGVVSLEVSRQYAESLPGELRDRYWVSDFIGTELPDVLALADVVISRSGAGTIAELTALGKPSVLVPLATSAGDEQVHNALHLQRAGGAVALVAERATAGELRREIEPLLVRHERRVEMAGAAARLGTPDAARRLVDVLLRVGSA
ncbi:UDP-N-acetylglucosamine--N-acetylmuramyl-(pentapeptide) pyrophosphoryl-undecaprenol N-acetylglucosamine transferase [Streptomyces sp. WMMC940]|uniref:UDP-N-acetylglucosamine--N-acetylmuramyl- (pentapeptide) pyrophosphoryl-undecaprenol N-acetylglucosamine transferase n=1 Tax=Streptomyces sp. WMMC940 TaxID=3015153 RepID=UPI0022B6EBDE|nr:UDP-N-acetylglucosamine--N-acetylmuramyl-(pentapeptide) pyrophosphoryl-undecaprenol N-acetylglucosamine transferase [Streptomyces sp. WMMC940]MCZ7458236.1 UDP-N-acetylglucosamine--N-acetylmuramyl-(pentapeptide) pyrophosphoryl-undecaprenol N-acetylglucosamine transferase [Streptomyces sp. WMMC940]